MAKVQNPITGRTSGKMANVVFSKWKSINTLRSKPLSVANPSTIGQVHTRDKFRLAVAMGRTVLQLIKQTMKEPAINKSEFNVFVEHAMRAIGFNSLIASVDAPQDLYFSRGSIPSLQGAAIGNITGNSIPATWTAAVNGTTSLGTDIVKAVAFNPNDNTVHISTNQTTRSTGTLGFTFDVTQPTLLDLQVWLVVYQPSTGKAGDSVYLS